MFHHFANLVHSVVNAIAPHHHHITNAAAAAGQHAGTVADHAAQVHATLAHAAGPGLSHAATGVSTTGHTKGGLQFGQETAPASSLIIARDGSGYKGVSDFVTGNHPYVPIKNS